MPLACSYLLATNAWNLGSPHPRNAPAQNLEAKTTIAKLGGGAFYCFSLVAEARAASIGEVWRRGAVHSGTRRWREARAGGGGEGTRAAAGW